MAEPRAPRPCIWVLAGTNGAGKSSIGGAMFEATGGEYFNPDTAARAIRIADPALSIAAANEVAWHEGQRRLQRAIAERKSFAFETTLGGRTITKRLRAAAEAGLHVRIWYAGLATPELHLSRVRARVARGGHDIPEEAIRRRYVDSLAHLVELLPRLTELRVYDNSAEVTPSTGAVPEPALVLHLFERRIVAPRDLSRTPDWAKPVVAAALKLSKRRER